MDILLANEKIGKIGLAGHIGVSHVHSHSGFVQEDGAGFSVLGKFFTWPPQWIYGSPK